MNTEAIDDDVDVPEIDPRDYGTTPREDKLAKLLDRYDKDVMGGVQVETEVVHQPQVDDVPQVFKLKVNGDDVEMPYDRAIATLQKHESADRRLAEIAERQRLLEEREYRLQLESQAIEMARTQSQQAPAQVPVDIDDDEINATLQAIYEGDTGTAATQLKALLSRQAAPVAPVVDQNAIIEQATIRAQQAMQQQLQRDAHAASLNRGKMWLRETYGDDVLNPESDTYLLLDAKMQRFAAQNPHLAPEEVIKQVASSTSILKPAVSAREVAKQNLHMPPTKSKSVSRPEEDYVETNADIAAQLRASRAATRNQRI